MDSRRESDSRPAGNGPATKSLGSTAHCTVTADKLWRLAGDCPPEQMFALSLGYRLGLLDGRDEGWRMAQLDDAVRWHQMFVSTREVLRRPTFAELQRRREVA